MKRWFETRPEERAFHVEQDRLWQDVHERFHVYERRLLQLTRASKQLVTDEHRAWLAKSQAELRRALDALDLASGEDRELMREWQDWQGVSSRRGLLREERKRLELLRAELTHRELVKSSADHTQTLPAPTKAIKKRSVYQPVRLAEDDFAEWDAVIEPLLRAEQARLHGVWQDIDREAKPLQVVLAKQFKRAHGDRKWLKMATRSLLH